LEKLKEIRHTIGPSPASLPIDNKKTVSVTSSVGNSSKDPKSSNMWYVIVTRATTTQLIAEQSPSSNSKNKLALKPKCDPERIPWPSF
jgi:hypothetical protein